MPWVRGHYARGPRTRRSRGLSTGAIILIILAVLVVVYLITH